MLLKNKTAIITGAAGGIGSVIAQTFIKEGCNVVLTDRIKPDLDKISKIVKKYNPKLLSAVVDVTNTKEVKRVVDLAQKKFSKIDILINAAGIQGPIGRFIKNDIKKWMKTIDVNLFGTILFIKSVLPIMMKQGYGKIINFSGGGAFNPRPNFSAYATSKAAVVRFTETLAEELKQYNIQVNAISPGAVNTKMLEEVLKAGSKATGVEFYEKAKRQKKGGGDSPRLAADLALFLLSDKSYNLSGKTISAKWDNWKKWDREKIKKIISSDLYTLRRAIR